MIIKSSEEWYQEYKNRFPMFNIIDADGWNREHFDTSWKELISKKEFVRRVSLSTCNIPIDMIQYWEKGEL